MKKRPKYYGALFFSVPKEVHALRFALVGGAARISVNHHFYLLVVNSRDKVPFYIFPAAESPILRDFVKRKF